MLKPSATFHKSPSGKLSVIESSADASICLEAYKNCIEPGEVVFLRKGQIDKFKKIDGIKVEKPKVVRKSVKKKI